MNVYDLFIRIYIYLRICFGVERYLDALMGEMMDGFMDGMEVDGLSVGSLVLSSGIVLCRSLTERYASHSGLKGK